MNDIPWTYERQQDDEGEFFAVADSSSACLFTLDVRDVSEDLVVRIIEAVNAFGEEQS